MTVGISRGRSGRAISQMTTACPSSGRSLSIHSPPRLKFCTRPLSTELDLAPPSCTNCRACISNRCGNLAHFRRSRTRCIPQILRQKRAKSILQMGYCGKTKKKGGWFRALLPRPGDLTNDRGARGRAHLHHYKANEGFYGVRTDVHPLCYFFASESL